MVIRANLLFILFFSLCLQIADAAVKKQAPQSSDNSLTTLKTHINNQEKEIKKLTSDMSKLESELGLGHKKYLDTLQRKREIELKLNEITEQQKQMDVQLKEKLARAQNSLKQQVLTALNSDSSPGAMLAQKLILKNLTEEIQIINRQIEDNQLMIANVEDLHIRYREYYSTEVELTALLTELEDKKRVVVDQYLAEKKKKEEISARYDKVRNQITLSKAKTENRATDLKFSSPLADYTKMDYGDKGLAYSYKGRHPVLSTQTGEIVYSGELSTFGYVVMIDHGNETRSVILGDFIPKATKGQKVYTGDVVGYTSASQSTGQVYFEVRKQNQVQNTAYLMEPKALDQSILARR